MPRFWATVAGSGGGGGGEITVQDEGNTLSSAVDTLNFLGNGVKATGSGSTISIYVPGFKAGLLADRVSASDPATLNALYFGTDSKLLYYSDGATWSTMVWDSTAITGLVKYGNLADRPASGAVNQGAIYYAGDKNVLAASTGSLWFQMNGLNNFTKYFPQTEYHSLNSYSVEDTDWDIPTLSAPDITFPNDTAEGPSTLVIVTGLTAPRTITLPALTYPEGYYAFRVLITCSDASISSTNTLTIDCDGVSDTIDGQSQIVLSQPTAALELMVSDVDSSTDAVKWKIISQYPSSVANLNVASKTTTYPITATDDLILCSASGGAFTATLPTAVGRTGKVYIIKKTDSSANAVTIATTSSQTMDGVTSIALITQYEVLQVVSDGSNWQVI